MRGKIIPREEGWRGEKRERAFFSMCCQEREDSVFSLDVLIRGEGNGRRGGAVEISEVAYIRRGDTHSVGSGS